MIQIETTELNIIVNSDQIKAMYYDKKEFKVEIIYTDNTKLECDDVVEVKFNNELL